jgi:hypothetical protein
LGIGDGEIGFLADWSMAGGHRATFRTPAATDGSAQLGFRPTGLTDLVRGATQGRRTVALAGVRRVAAGHRRRLTAWVPPTDPRLHQVDPPRHGDPGKGRRVRDADRRGRLLGDGEPGGTGPPSTMWSTTGAA